MNSLVCIGEKFKKNFDMLPKNDTNANAHLPTHSQSTGIRVVKCRVTAAHVHNKMFLQWCREV